MIDEVGQKEFTNKQMEKFPVLLSCIKKQIKVVHILTTANEKISLIDKIKVLIHQKKRLIQKSLTGKWRVKVECN